MNRKLVRPVLINIVIVAVLLLTDVVFNTHDDSRFFFSGTMILFVAAANFLIGMIRNRNRTGDGHYYFLFAGTLLLIGFSVCSASVG